MKNRILAVVSSVCLIISTVFTFPVLAASKTYYISDGSINFKYALTTIGTSATLVTKHAKNFTDTKKGVVKTIMRPSDAPPNPESDAPFQGWANNRDAAGNQIITKTYQQTTCTTTKPTNTIDVWARFDYKVTVTYNANGGLVNGQSTYEKTLNEITYGRRHFSKISFTVPTPTRSGYKFLGWKSDNLDIGSTVKAGATIKPIVRNTTLTAQWEAIDTEPIYVPPTKPATSTPTPAAEPKYDNALYVPAYVTKGGAFGVKSDNDYSLDASSIKQITYQLRDGASVISSITGVLSNTEKTSSMILSKYKGRMTAPSKLDKGNVNMVVLYNNGTKAEINKPIQLLDSTADYGEGVRYIGNGVLPNPEAKWWKDLDLRNKLLNSLKKLVPEEKVRFYKVDDL